MPEGSGAVTERVWWGEYRIPPGKSGRFRIGPMTLVVSRLVNELRVSRCTSGAPSDTEVDIDVPSDDDDMGTNAAVTRYGLVDEDEMVLIEPVMPDRSVVTRPEEPLIVPAEESVNVYVGSPLWIRVSAGEPRRALGDFPASPPQLTWWGPNTMVGEMCYATRTYGRLRLEEAKPGPHRVLTAARVVNRASTPLVIERLNLPVRTLSIYSENGSTRLWTEAVTLDRGEGEELAELTVGTDPGADVDDAELVTPPRAAHAGNYLFRAFGKLFS